MINHWIQINSTMFSNSVQCVVEVYKNYKIILSLFNIIYTDCNSYRGGGGCAFNIFPACSVNTAI